MEAYRDGLELVLQNAQKCHISHIITIGTDLKSSSEAIRLSKTHNQVFATIGIHPHDVNQMDDSVYEKLSALYTSNAKHIVGYGEIGLDYVKKYSPSPQQREHFSRQLVLADKLKLPVIIHNREADADTLKILKSADPLHSGGIMHCFSSDYSFAKKILDLGMLISIPGIVTFKNALSLQEVVKKIPLSSMLLETDGPFLAPHPYRGKRNEPAYLIHTAAKIAEIRKIPIDTVAYQTTENAKKLFQIT